MSEMLAHELLEPGNKKCGLYRLAVDDVLPPTRNGHVIGINKLMAKRVLASDQ